MHAFINAMGEESISDSFMVALFDDLSRLSRLDIRVLNLHAGEYLFDNQVDDDYSRLIAEEGIDESQYRSIRQKLCRLVCFRARTRKSGSRTSKKFKKRWLTWLNS